MVIKKALKHYAKISVALNVILVLILVFALYKVGGVSFLSAQFLEMFGEERVSSEKALYDQRTSLFEDLEIETGSVVFVGDSLIQYSEWAELIPEEKVYNRGIGGDTTYGVKNRIKEIVDSKPSVLVLMVGINDLTYGIDSAEANQNYEAIFKQIKEGTPDTKVIVNSALPVNKDLFINEVTNREVKELNVMLSKKVERFGFNFVDLYGSFERHNQLDERFTVDGVHLNGEGYMLWKQILKDVL